MHCQIIFSPLSALLGGTLSSDWLKLEYDLPKFFSEPASNSGHLPSVLLLFHQLQVIGRMTDRIQPYTTPPTSPRGAFVSPRSPSSPRSFHTFPLVPPAPVGTHPRHPTRHVAAA